MRADVHLAALKAAAKVAFSVALLNACSNPSAASQAPATDETSNDSELVSRSSAENPPDPCPTKDDAGAAPDAAPDSTTPPAASCEATLEAAFAGNTDMWEPHPESAEVIACCDSLLTETPFTSNHRWSCCTAYDPAVTTDGTTLGSQEKFYMACTPWGPPVPPAMKRSMKAVA
jgi:hypothetical protein